jgi:peptide/nickel transport system substrate-binding protein
MLRRRFALHLVFLALSLAVTAAPAEAQTSPRRGGVLVVAHADDPAHYDAHQTTTFAIAQPTAPVFSTLLQFDPQKYPELIGDLATAWRASPDGLTHTFTLRQNVRFHDGGLLTSADVRASMERVKTPPRGVVSVWGHLLNTVEAIDTPDPHTVVFRLSRPTPSFVTHMANPFLRIYSKALLDADPNGPKTKMVGTGPFKYKAHVPGVSLDLERFDDYFVPGRPYLDGIRYVIIRDTQARATALIGGRADAELRDLPPLVVQQIETAARDRMRVIATDWLAINDLTWDVRKKPFDDVRVRLAINCAIDAPGMVTALGPIAGIRHIGKWGRPNSAWEMPDDRFQKLPCWSPDVEANRQRARDLLREAGHGGGLALKLTNRNVPHPYLSIGVYVIEQLGRVGIKVTHNVVDSNTWVTAWRNLGEGEMATTFNSPPYDDPDAFFGARIPGAAGDYARTEDPEVSRLYEQQSREINVARRRELVWQLESRLWEQAYWGKGTWSAKHTILSRRVQNYVPHPNHFTNVKLQDVWLSP